jgi:hypothetical protein
MTGIDKLIWKALTDTAFCEGIFNGRRREMVDALDLTRAEREAVLAVQADTLEEFAGALCRQSQGPITWKNKSCTLPTLSELAESPVRRFPEFSRPGKSRTAPLRR